MYLEDAIDSINRYVETGVPTGGFLRACLANDLMEAMGKADLTSRACLFEITGYIYNNIPMVAHGSYDIVDNWPGTVNMDKDAWKTAQVRKNEVVR